MLKIVDAPSVVPDDPFSNLYALIDRYESVTDAWGEKDMLVDQLDEEVRAISERYPHFAKYALFMVRGAKITRGNGGPERWETRRPDQDEQDIGIAREYLRRETEYARLGEHISPSKIKEEVGRRFGMSRSGAISKINRGLAIIERRKTVCPDCAE